MPQTFTFALLGLLFARVKQHIPMTATTMPATFALDNLHRRCSHGQVAEDRNPS